MNQHQPQQPSTTPTAPTYTNNINHRHQQSPTSLATINHQRQQYLRDPTSNQHNTSNNQSLTNHKTNETQQYPTAIYHNTYSNQLIINDKQSPVTNYPQETISNQHNNLRHHISTPTIIYLPTINNPAPLNQPSILRHQRPTITPPSHLLTSYLYQSLSSNSHQEASSTNRPTRPPSSSRLSPIPIPKASDISPPSTPPSPCSIPHSPLGVPG
jgi:hypothetical protein